MEYVNLGDVATYINGYAFKPEQRGKKGLPIIRIQDLNGNSHDLGFFDGEYPKQVEINAGDILISWSGSLGVYKWNKGKALLNQHIFKVLFNKIKIDKEYFCYAIRNSLAAMSQQTHGATMKHITKKDFDNILIPYPDLNVQRQIANNLEIVNELIEYYEKELILLEQLIKARFIEMFGDPIRNPYGWYNDCLNNVCTKINDGTHCSPESFDKGDYMYITAKNIKQNGLDLSNVTYVSEKVHKPIYQRCNPEFGDILYIKDGATTGIATINTMKNEFTLLSSVALLKYDRSLINGYYLIHLLNSKEMYSKIRKNMGGAAITRLTIAKIKEIKVIVPPIDLQNQFADFIQQVDKSREAVKKSLEKTQQLYDSLMQEYFG